jgi:hypothetical protein
MDRDLKKLMLLLMLVTAIFGWFVWPTRYHYFDYRQSVGFRDGYVERITVEGRRDRFSGHIEVYSPTRGDWVGTGTLWYDEQAPSTLRFTHQ